MTFTLSVVAPNNDPVTIEWTDDCDDSTFAAPQSPTTSWSKATEGACNVIVTATSNGLSVRESFSIAIFPAGSASGAVDVNGVFVAAPRLYMQLSNETQSCYLYPGISNASCLGSTASPSITTYRVGIDSWGNSTPGTIEVSDNCGGTFGTDSLSEYSRSGRWLPPVEGAACIITARVVNGDGVRATLSAAVLVRPGTPRPPAQPPRVRINTSSTYGSFCSFSSDGSPLPCGALSDNRVFVTVFVDWNDGLPGPVSIMDDCGGTFTPFSGTSSFSITWSVPNSPGTACTLAFQATNLEGTTNQAVGVFELY